MQLQDKDDAELCLQIVVHSSGSMRYTVFMLFLQEKVKESKKQSKKKEQEMSSMNKKKRIYRLSVLCLQFPTDFSNTEKLCCLMTVFPQMYCNGKADSSFLRKQFSSNILK